MSTPPVFLVPPGALGDVTAGARWVLDGDQGRHATTVRRLRPGEPVDLVDGAGVRARCQVVAGGRAGLELAVLDLVSEPAAEVELILAQALAKGGRDEQAVEAATELGVHRVVAWQAERCVVRWAADRAEHGLRRWRSGVQEAAKQARRAWLPEVQGPVDGAGLAEQVRAVVGAGGAAVVLDAEGDLGLAEVALPRQGQVLLIVGPEGGISPAERAGLIEAGALTARVGRQVLRASTAGPAAVAVLVARLDRA